MELSGCADQQLDFGAAEHDSLGTGFGRVGDDAAVDLPALLPHHSKHSSS